ncbi:glutathione peroxidase [Tahibacter sp. UC22_41]|uniref:glutathione peroxidase n=1 Tax=Tahibacter sp. UC22_41 TaxID=3350178 RepID=UPI0036D760A7
MRRLVTVFLLSAAAAAPAWACSDLLNSEYRPLAGKDKVSLCGKYDGQVLLIVNTASKCGFTPQYEGLEQLHAKYAGQGFAVLGFPSNDFKQQEPGSEKEIQEFCTLTYGVKFPMFEKVHVTKEEATPLYVRLADASGGRYPTWNFYKYLIGRDGKVIADFPSKVKPDDAELVAAIEKAIAAKPAK